MVERELAVYWIGYNLMRALMVDGALAHARLPAEISFKAAVQLTTHWAPAAAGVESIDRQHHMMKSLLEYLGRHLLKKRRKRRREPRALKRRKKDYQMLAGPRHEFLEVPHRSRYVKTKPA